MSSCVVRSGVVFLIVALGSAATAQTDAQRCEAVKLKRGAIYGECRLKAESRSVLTSTQGDLARCDARLIRTFASAEASFGGACPTTGDVATVQSVLAGCTDQVSSLLSGGGPPACRRITATGQNACWDQAGTAIACAGSGQDGAVQAGATLSYNDNGDGTITDLATGLMWEKKSDDGSIHDYDQRWDWAGGFSQLVATLNATGFAGYNDWRVPNVKELQSIVNYGTASPAVDPVFHHDCLPGCDVTACSCTTLDFYWTSTSHVLGPVLARLISFEVGSVVLGAKNLGVFPVRAVRGGT